MATKTKKQSQKKLLDMVTPASTTLAEKSAKRIASMSVTELNEHIKLCNEMKAKSAPTMESMESDLLILLQVLSRAFVERYYPTATSASLNINRYEDLAGERPFEFHVHFPVYDRASTEAK